jgi:hypothetical protein
MLHTKLEATTVFSRDVAASRVRTRAQNSSEGPAGSGAALLLIESVSGMVGDHSRPKSNNALTARGPNLERTKKPLDLSVQ